VAVPVPAPISNVVVPPARPHCSHKTSIPSRDTPVVQRDSARDQPESLPAECSVEKKIGHFNRLLHQQVVLPAAAFGNHRFASKLAARSRFRERPLSALPRVGARVETGPESTCSTRLCESAAWPVRCCLPSIRPCGIIRRSALWPLCRYRHKGHRQQPMVYVIGQSPGRS